MGWRLFAFSFVALFLELMIIRWSPSVVRLIAYYANLILISSFLGLGVGTMLSAGRRNLLNLFPLLLLAQVGMLVLGSHAALPGSSDEGRFYLLSQQKLLDYAVLVAIFASNAAMFVPLGQQMATSFKPCRRSTPIRGTWVAAWPARSASEFSRSPVSHHSPA